MVALHRITRMSKLRDIKVLHLESTDVCQAACPLCARETDMRFDKNKKHHLSMEQILAVFSEKNIAKLDKMFMCGNYGDPAAGSHTLDIYQQFRKINPKITLGMNTNGAIQNTTWWSKLGQLFNQELDYCVFSIDGLADTNHIYRKNVNWDNLIANAKAYIAAGGKAHWDMLVYKHNEHQVDACESLARELGFTWFRAKISKRPFIDGLEAPINWQIQNRAVGNIDCYALKDQSMYIDARGRVSVCCWLGSTQINFIEDIEEVKASWTSSSPNPTCVSTCSTSNNKTTFENQWHREVALC